jgi:hypothetical protein
MSCLIFEIWHARGKLQKYSYTYTSDFRGQYRINLSYIYIGYVKSDVAPYFLTLVNRNNPICVVSPKEAKASTIVAVAVAGVIALNSAPMETIH